MPQQNDKSNERNTEKVVKNKSILAMLANFWHCWPPLWNVIDEDRYCGVKVIKTPQKLRFFAKYCSSTVIPNWKYHSEIYPFNGNKVFNNRYQFKSRTYSIFIHFWSFFYSFLVFAEAFYTYIIQKIGILTKECFIGRH